MDLKSLSRMYAREAARGPVTTLPSSDLKLLCDACEHVVEPPRHVAVIRKMISESSVDAVATRAGVSRRTIYHWLRSKHRPTVRAWQRLRESAGL